MKCTNCENFWKRVFRLKGKNQTATRLQCLREKDRLLDLAEEVIECNKFQPKQPDKTFNNKTT